MASSAKKLKMSSWQSKSTAFSYEEDEILVELVAQNPTLYDIKLEAYKDGLKKENIWKDIGNALNKTSDECRKRWKYIKDSYNRYKRKKKAGTGSAALSKTSKWEFYERLKFLESSSYPGKGISNVPSFLKNGQNESMDAVGNEDNDSNEKYNSDDDDENDTQSTQSSILNELADEGNALNQNKTEKVSKQNINQAGAENIQKHITNNTEKAASKKKRQTRQAELLQYMKERDMQRQALLKQACEEKVEKDDVNSFGDHVKSILRKLPPILRVKLKAEIFNVMSKYELMSMEANYSTHSASSMSNYSTYKVHSPITSPTSPQQKNYNECTTTSMPSLSLSDK